MPDLPLDWGACAKSGAANSKHKNAIYRAVTRAKPFERMLICNSLIVAPAQSKRSPIGRCPSRDILSAYEMRARNILFFKTTVMASWEVGRRRYNAHR